MAGNLYLSKPIIKKKNPMFSLWPVIWHGHDLAPAHLSDPHLVLSSHSLQPHWASFCSTNTPRLLLPQGLCKCASVFLECSSLELSPRLVPSHPPTSHVTSSDTLLPMAFLFSSEHLNIQNYLSSLLVCWVLFFVIFFSLTSS